LPVKAKPPDGGGWLAADSAQLARGIWKYPLYIFTFEGSLQMCEKYLTLPVISLHLPLAASKTIRHNISRGMMEESNTPPNHNHLLP
jgi:hypothetical protein